MEHPVLGGLQCGFFQPRANPARMEQIIDTEEPSCEPWFCIDWMVLDIAVWEEFDIEGEDHLRSLELCD